MNFTKTILATTLLSTALYAQGEIVTSVKPLGFIA